MRKNKNHTVEIEEIITAPPAWILRIGIASIVATISSIIILSSFIKYPDTVSAKMLVKKPESGSNDPGGETNRMLGITARSYHELIRISRDKKSEKINRFRIDEEKGKPYAELRIPELYFEQIKKGQAVTMRFDRFPYRKYGTMSGHIFSVTDSLDNGTFSAIVVFDNVITKSTRTTILLKNGMMGDARIAVKENSLLMKIFQSFKTDFQN